MTASAPAVEAHGVCKSFGATSVLNGVELDVPTGSVAAILGPSGSGKTTLLRLVAGFERPDLGSISIAGRLVANEGLSVPPERRQVGYVSQEGSLFPHLSVRRNIGFGLTRRLRRGGLVDHLIEVVGLEGLADRYPHELSGGQQQRVAVARALATEPRVVLLDEPFASLDANLRASVRTEVFAILRKAGTTAVLVTHDQDEALSVADLVAVLLEGLIVQTASPRQLYEHPNDPVVAAFVGEANLLEGLATGHSVQTPLGELPLSQPRDGVAGERVTVLLRPEQLSVLPGDSGQGLRAVVLGSEFHGHDATVRLTLERVQPLPLVARVPGHLAAPPGTSVVVSVAGPVEAWPAVSPPAPG